MTSWRKTKKKLKKVTYPRWKAKLFRHAKGKPLTMEVMLKAFDACKEGGNDFILPHPVDTLQDFS